MKLVTGVFSNGYGVLEALAEKRRSGAEFATGTVKAVVRRET